MGVGGYTGNLHTFFLHLIILTCCKSKAALKKTQVITVIYYRMCTIIHILSDSDSTEIRGQALERGQLGSNPSLTTF